MPKAVVTTGDVVEWLRAMPDNHAHAVLCDPPYGLSDHQPKDVVACLTAWLRGEVYAPDKQGFMGRAWDAWVPGPEVWREAYRALKPGGHLLAFAGTRSMDLMSMAIRLAGFELRDAIGYASDDGDRAPLAAWVYGTGMPHSHNVGRGMAATAQTGGARTTDLRRVAMGDSYEASGRGRDNYDHGGGSAMNGAAVKAPLTGDAAVWEGYGSALKPAWEPIIIARKPLAGSLARNAMAHGCGALAIDACLVPVGDDEAPVERVGESSQDRRYTDRGSTDLAVKPGVRRGRRAGDAPDQGTARGRHPANVIHSGGAGVLACFPDAKGQRGAATGNEPSVPGSNVYGTYGQSQPLEPRVERATSAARFFYCAKARRADRDFGLDDLTAEPVVTFQTANGTSGKASSWSEGRDTKYRNRHPTVKPTALTEYLARLLLPPALVKQRTILVPFAGSGSEMIGAIRAGWDVVEGCEREPEYADLARRRCVAAGVAEVPAGPVSAPAPAAAEVKQKQFDLFGSVA
ncbi:MAG: hypothetical protein GC191_09015 [Azospirillum sp.]|nr:hypothetical protein [Azospirillum sp.]